MIAKVLATGSSGNAVLYGGNILVDVGVPYRTISDYANDIRLVLLTHIHGDHFNKSTIRRLAINRPTLRFACGEWLYDDLIECGVLARNIDVMGANEVYNYPGLCRISPFELYHDVPNFGWRIFFTDNYSIFHATDTFTLDGIEAVGYDLYAIEHNYSEKHVFADIEHDKSMGKYAYQEDAIKVHLSFERAQEFFEQNKDFHSQLIKLHISSRYKE